MERRAVLFHHRRGDEQSDSVWFAGRLSCWAAVRQLASYPFTSDVLWLNDASDDGRAGAFLSLSLNDWCAAYGIRRAACTAQQGIDPPESQG